jgi:dihydrofolate reductase
VQEWMSLDGVVQAPGAADEDTTGSFQHGGWRLRYFDDTSMNWVVENVAGAGGYLLGRRTYQGFAGYWPNASDEQRVLAEPPNTRPKYVASTTLTDPLEWENSRVTMFGRIRSLRRMRRKRTRIPPGRRRGADHRPSIGGSAGSGRGRHPREASSREGNGVVEVGRRPRMVTVSRKEVSPRPAPPRKHGRSAFV